MAKIVHLAVLAIMLLITVSCGSTPHDTNQVGRQVMKQKDINATLKDHENALLAIPGVVGVYVGVLPDDKTPCLKVMVIEEAEELRRRIPASIEGYPVLIEETGIIRPLIR
jgi:hypothetical protein